MTTDEKNEIIKEILVEINTSSVDISELTPISTYDDTTSLLAFSSEDHELVCIDKDLVKDLSKTTAEESVTSAINTLEEADQQVLQDAKSYTDSKDSTLRTDISSTTTDLQNQITTGITEAKTYTDTSIANLAGSAPETLDTLQELATALGNDPNFSATILDMIGERVTAESLADSLSGYLPLTGGTLTGALAMPSATLNDQPLYNKAQNDVTYAKLDDGLTTTGLTIWVGTESEYGAISTKDSNTLYVINK